MTDSEKPPIRLERDGDVAVIVLDDPPLNLFTEETFTAMRAARDEVADSDARAMVFRAEGDLFTGGVDVGRVFKDVSGGAEGSRLAADGIRELQAFESLEVPTLALVHGLCLTAGLEASLGCDMIWAADDARFGLVERVVGLTPFGGGVQRMAERAGPARAREFVMTGDKYSAATLYEWGVINKVWPDEELEERALELAKRLADGPTLAHAVRLTTSPGAPNDDTPFCPTPRPRPDARAGLNRSRANRRSQVERRPGHRLGQQHQRQHQLERHRQH